MAPQSSRNRFIVRATAGYLVFAALWILVSDHLLHLLPDIGHATWLSTAKGLSFVAVTAALLYKALQAVPPAQAQPSGGLVDTLLSQAVHPGWPAWVAYAFAFALSVTSVAARLALAPAIGNGPLLTVFVPVAFCVVPLCLSALAGGFGPGLLATAIAVAGFDVLLVPPLGEFKTLDPGDLARLSFIAASGIALSLVCEVMHRARRSVELDRVLLNAIVSRTTDAIYMKDHKGRYVFCNEATARLIGQRVHQVLGRTDAEMFPVSSAAVLNDVERHVLESGVTRDYEERLTLHDGRMRTFLSSKGPVHDEAGRVIGLFGIARDITEREQIERTLRLRSSALVAAANAIVITDPDGTVAWCNPAFTGLSGYDMQEAVGRKIGDLVRSGTRSADDYRILWQTILSGRVWTGEVVNRRKDGSLYEELQTITPVTDETGRIQNFVAIKQDITERKRAERLQREQARVLEMIARNAPIEQTLDFLVRGIESQAPDILCSILLYDEPGKCLRHGAAPSLPDAYNRGVDGLIIGPRAGSCGTSAHRRMPVFVEDITTDPLWSDFQSLVALTDFRACWSTPIIDAAGDLLGTFAIYSRQPGRPTPKHFELVEVATHTAAICIGSARAQRALEGQRRQLEERVVARTSELQQAVSYLRTLIDNLPFNIWLKDTDGRFLQVNRAHAESKGRQVEEIIGRTDFDLWPADRAADNRAVDAEVMASRRTRSYQRPQAHGKGTVWLETLKSPVIDGQGRVIGTVGFARDISDQKMLESERESARLAAENLARTKSAFLANMSHEIRTPLNGVLGLARIGYQESQGHASQKTFGRILDSGKLLLGIIDDILDFSKIEAGKLNVESVPIDVKNVIAQVIDLLRAQSDAKGLTLAIEASSNLPALCLGDPVRLTQVILNLISNAIKFTPHGSITVSTSRDGTDLVFSVADTGIGINDDQMNALFTPFEQADSSTTRIFGGTGLGLAITKRLVELMGGRIEVRSQAGCGSTFLVRLPFKPAPAGSSAAREAPPSSQAGPGRLAGLRILAAEDGEINRIVLETLLHNDGAQAVMVTTGREAVDRLRQEGADAFDLVLMDIQMPEMDGYEAAGVIRSMSPGLPIVGQSAHAMAEDRERCLAAGMCDYIAKPIDPDKLSDTILRHAGKMQLHNRG